MSSSLRKRTVGTARVLTRDARLAWVTIAVLLALLFMPALLTCSAEAAFRYAGLGLQLAGLLLVAWGIRETRKRFGRPSLGESLRRWFLKLKRAAFPPPGSGSGHPVTVLPGTAEGTFTGFPPTVSTTMEERLAALEAKLRGVQLQLTKFRSETTKAAQELRKAVAQETARREQADSGIRTLIEDQSAGGLHLEAMGLVWLLVGTLAGSLSAELALLFPGFPCIW